MAMPRPVRWILYVLGGALALLLVAALAVPYLIDVQRFAPAITASLRSMTGREVTLGRIAFRILPSPAVTVTPVSVREGPRYPGRDAVRLQSLAVRVRLLPLLRGRVEFGAIVLDRPTLTLIRDAEGRFNFDDVLTRAKGLAAADGKPAPAGAAPPISIARAEIKDGKVLVYDDAVIKGKRSELVLAPIDAAISGWGLPGGATFDLSAGLGESRLAARGKMAPAGQPAGLSIKVPGSRINAADLTRLFPWLGVASPRGLAVAGTLEVTGDAEVPLEAQGAIPFHGTIAIDGLSYKDAALARPVEKVGGRLAIDGERAEWTDFTATIGQSTIGGRLRIENYMAPRIGFDLKADRINLDDLFGSLAAAPAGGGGGGGTASTDTALRGITAKGSLAAGSLKFQGFDLTNVRGTATLEDGVIGLSDLAAGLCSGSLKGGASADLARGAPAIRLDAVLKEIDVDALAASYDPALRGLVRGRLAGDLGLQAKGATMDALLDTARGRVRLSITQGAVTSISVLKQLAGLLEMAGGKGIGRDETPFDSLTGIFAVGGRRAVTDDLMLDSADLDLSGRGSLGLDMTLDLGVLARFSPEATAGMVEKTAKLKAFTDGEGRLAVNLLASGSLAAPKVALDTTKQVRQFQEQKKAEVKEKVRNRLLDLLGGKKPTEEKPPESKPPADPPPADGGGGGY
jgi:AsmA protein